MVVAVNDSTRRKGDVLYATSVGLDLGLAVR